jgi:thioredoxin-dependent peroxiredoxin
MHPMTRSRNALLAAALAAVLLAPACNKAEENPSPQPEVTKPAEPAQPDPAAAAKTAEPTAVAPETTEEAAPTPLAEGSEAPDFTAPAHDGTTVELAKLRGKPVVLYFYPKDETPGCTVEAQTFRDELPELAKLDAKLIGVSMDTLESHKAFAENHKLNFPLISDTDGAIAAKYGVDTSKGYTVRVTFVIGADGKIAKVYPAVKVQGHADEVLAALQSMK